MEMIESLGSYSFQLTFKSLKFKTFRDETEGGCENTNIEDAPSPFSVAA